MAKGNNETLTAEQEMQLRQSTEGYVDEIQKKTDSLRADGTNRVVALQNNIDATKGDRSPTKEEGGNGIVADSAEMEKAKAVEVKNRDGITKLIPEAESYLEGHPDRDYHLPLKEGCERGKALVEKKYGIKVAELNKKHGNTLSKLMGHQEIEDEKCVRKNRLFGTKMDLDEELQRTKDRRHTAFVWQYHLIDMFRLSKFTFMETRAQRWGNYKYTFNRRTFLLQNGPYIAIILIFIGLYAAAPVMKSVKLPAYSNVLNTPQQAPPKMSLALGVAGPIPLTGTDLFTGRMVSVDMTTAAVTMHQGINTGIVLEHVFDFTGIPIGLRVVSVPVMYIILCTRFMVIGGFFTAKFKMHPSISTMANVLAIFGLITYATKGVSFGTIEPATLKMIIPKINESPIIILWAVAAIVIIWFIWNKTTFGKDLYAVGGNPETVAASDISVFGVTMGAFILVGILYGSGSWLECARMVGPGSAAYDQGWEMDAIVVYVVGGVSFTDGIGRTSDVVVSVLIFTVPIHSLTILGIDTNLQFVFEGIVIIAAITLDCLKYIQKKWQGRLGVSAHN